MVTFKERKSGWTGNVAAPIPEDLRSVYLQYQSTKRPMGGLIEPDKLQHAKKTNQLPRRFRKRGIMEDVTPRRRRAYEIERNREEI